MARHKKGGKGKTPTPNTKGRASGKGKKSPRKYYVGGTQL